jgi:methylenetetrahydrofolate reductase (NADPH)
LTCIDTPKSMVQEVAEDFLQAGVRTFLALRGDPPKHLESERPPLSDQIRDAAELTYLLRSLDKRRQRATAAGQFRTIARPLVICVAAFPSGNVELGTNQDQEVDRLLEKQDAGADFAITQLYYDPREYDTFMRKARSRGVTIPVLAGVLPTWRADRLIRTEANLGVPAPADLVAQLEEAVDDLPRRREIALNYWENLSREALNSGSPGVHMFTFNKSEPPLALADRLGLLV